LSASIAPQEHRLRSILTDVILPQSLAILSRSYPLDVGSIDLAECEDHMGAPKGEMRRGRARPLLPPPRQDMRRWLFDPAAVGREKGIEASNGAELIESIIFKRDWTQLWTQTPRYGTKLVGMQ
jgi:hypothetical protein